MTEQIVVGLDIRNKQFISLEYEQYSVVVKISREQHAIRAILKANGFRWNAEMIAWENQSYDRLKSLVESDDLSETILKQLFDEIKDKLVNLRLYEADGDLSVFGDTFSIKDQLKKIGFRWGGYEPEPHWKLVIENLIENRDIINALPEILRNKLNSYLPEESEEVAEEIDYGDFYEPEGFSLYEHQKDGIKEIIKHDCYLHSWEMGGGKTIPPLSYAKTTNKKVFAVVPAIVRLNWFREADKFELSPVLFPKVPGMKKVYKDYFSRYNIRDSQVAVTSYSTYNRLSKKTIVQKINGKDVKKGVMDIEKLDNIARQYDLFVFDESQYIKNYKAQRTKAVLQLIKLAKKYKKKVLFLSGTPLLNRPAELYTTLKQLIPQLEGFVAFTRRYNGAFDNGWGWTMGEPSNLGELHNRMKPVSSRILKEDVMDLPDKVRQDVLIETARVKVPEAPQFQSEILGWMQKYKHAVAMSKIKATVDIAKESTPCLVFTGFIKVNDEIAEALRKEGLRVAQIYSGKNSPSSGEKDNIVQKYQNGELDVIVGGIKAMGVGLTLTTGSNVIFNDMDWTPGNMLQAEDRAHRPGQKNNVTVIILRAPDEFDEMLFNKVSSKYDVVTKVLDDQEGNFSSSIFGEMKAHFMAKYKFNRLPEAPSEE